jgi:hypothetical protein
MAKTRRKATAEAPVITAGTDWNENAGATMLIDDGTTTQVVHVDGAVLQEGPGPFVPAEPPAVSVPAEPPAVSAPAPVEPEETIVPVTPEERQEADEAMEALAAVLNRPSVRPFRRATGDVSTRGTRNTGR